MTTILKISIVLLCGWVLMGTVKQVGNDFSNIRADNMEHIERVISDCR